MTTVSVIIPAYNHATFLQKTIESVLDQDWRDYEIVVVDDGSKDDTPAVAARFGSAIRYIPQTNHGMAATRNIGIRHAAGDLISFLDDDDLWLPNYLSTVVARFQADPDLAALHTGFQLTSDKEGSDFPAKGTRTVPAHELYHSLIESGFFPPSSVTVRRACLDKVGLFDEGLQGYADWELWLRLCREFKFIGIPQVLVKYRIHAGGLSSNVEHMTQDRLKAIRKHFGPPEGDPATWPLNKRQAFAFAYRNAAVEYGMRSQPDDVRHFMRQAVATMPELLERLDTFYELACGEQPRGYRNQPALLDMACSEKALFEQVELLLADGGPAVVARRGIAYGNAYLALGMLSDQAGQWSDARRYLLRAIRANPRFLGSFSFVRRFLKLCAGQRLARLGRSLDDKRQASTFSTRV